MVVALFSIFKRSNRTGASICFVPLYFYSFYNFLFSGTLLALQNRSKVAVINLNSTVKAELAKGAKAVNVKYGPFSDN